MELLNSLLVQMEIVVSLVLEVVRVLVELMQTGVGAVL